MTETDSNDRPDRQQVDDATRSLVERKAQRRAHAQQNRSSALWYGLGTMGVVGWSVAVPTVLGVLIGLWLDENVPMSFSWVLTGLTGGIFLGSLNAWSWISSERQKIQARRAPTDDETEPQEET